MHINNIHGVANARGSVSSTPLSVKETQASSSVFKGQKDELTLSNRSVILDSIPSELVDTSTNSVHIQSDIVYSLGQVNGKTLKMSLEDYNQQTSPFTSELLNTIGIDGSRPFSVNGVKFRLEDGMLYKL